MHIKAWYVVFRSKRTNSRVTVYIHNEDSMTLDLVNVINNMSEGYTVLTVDPVMEKDIVDE